MKDLICTKDLIDDIIFFLKNAPDKILECCIQNCFEVLLAKSKKQPQMLDSFISQLLCLLDLYTGGEKMDKIEEVYEEIRKQYEKFNIPEENIPDYDGNIYNYLGNIKKASILKYEPSYYSTRTEAIK